jgi:hypothetical protein
MTTTSASADEADEPMRIDFPRARDNKALEQWHDEHGWRYDTGYLFGITRGLEIGMRTQKWRPALWIVTVPFDVVSLPVAAAAGLFGD